MKDFQDKETALNLKMMIIIGKMIKAIDQSIIPEINANGLTPTQFGVLEALYNKGSLTVNEIIEKTLSSSGNMGLVIKNLERSGLILKKISDVDRRSRKVELTEKGRKIIADFFPIHVQSINKMFSGMDYTEKTELAELMKKLSKSIGD